jgi:Leucine-rich repeat (LRR) protein
MKTLKLILICFLVSAYAFADISSSEKEALIALYKSTNGTAWNSTWNLNNSVDTWHGVTIENDKVVEINLPFNNLEGVLPQEIGSLVYLRKVNLGFNKITGEIPKSLANLKDLTSLELFMNRFVGAIPSELGTLKKLESLKLYSNNLTGEIPASLMELTNLEELLLGSNFLT